MENIYIKISSPAIDNIIISDRIYNPGMGGTEFVTIRLYMELFDKFTDHDSRQIYLVTDNSIKFEEKKYNKYLCSDKQFQINNTYDDWFIVPSRFAHDYDKIKSQRVIWSHNPHEYLKCKIRKNDKIVCLGTYHTFSNELLNKLGRNSVHTINNYPCFTLSKNWKINTKSNYAVFMGSISPAKGLPDALLYFNELL